MDIVYFDENHVIRVQKHTINFLILVTSKIKDFISHYLKLMVLQCYT